MNNPNNDLAQALFFSKRKANQHFGCNKGTMELESQPVLHKAFSERKPKSGFQLLRNNQNVDSFNLNNQASLNR